ncbi:MAG: DUF4235 domain-containing protein [Actinomycetota bacterium]|nr:DUF4235 domain-containing protein [Actinomycetota bacterium]
MARILFAPFSVVGGFLAGMAGRRLFAQVWSHLRGEEPPDPSHRRMRWSTLLLAAAVEGAIFRVVKNAFDRGTRHAFLNVTGAWPGEEGPDPEP